MASDSENTPPETLLNCKPKRRSSIFRPTIAERTLPYDETFPPNYKNELLQENDKWDEAYTNIISEYLELKEKGESKVQTAPSVDLAIYKTYLRKAEDFCSQINNIVEQHENAINYLNIRRQELGKQVEATSKMIRGELNL